MSKLTQGIRLFPEDKPKWEARIPAPGSYWLAARKTDDNKEVWFCITPNGHMGSLAAHDITEHDDGTITVSPSIMVRMPQGGGQEVELYHGWLERGVWRDC